MKFALAGAALIVATATLNPSADRHREALREALSERSLVAGALGLSSLAAFASTYHTLGVASYTRVGDRVTTVGMLGIVFVTA